MYLDYNDYYNKFNQIAEVSDEIIRTYLNGKPNLILDLGSRYGENFLRFGLKYNCKYIFVEPSPKCIPKIEALIKEYSNNREFQFIKGILGQGEGNRDLILFENDGDQSANLYSNRNFIYGKPEKVQIKMFDYSIIKESNIDFAKINIEGGEYELVESDFFHKIQCFVMEAHNKIIRKKNYKDIIKKLKKTYDLETYGHLKYKYCFIIGNRL